MILARYQMILTRYQELGVEVSSSAATSSLVHGPHRTRSSSLAAASFPVHGPHRSSSLATASSVGSTSPAAASVVHASTRGRVLHAGAAAITTQDPLPSMPHTGARRRRRLYHHAGSSAVHVTMPHAGARRWPCPPCRSSSPAAASSTPKLVVGAAGARCRCRRRQLVYARCSHSGPCSPVSGR
ncbi:Os03g0100600 [Oryza sativa Japonica Group]|uniref:Os03g0100600 protein n=1 Tax=Oryza sativa subsp. japonica TaxID=39947 RepID=A0A0P0VRW4_ORYSJ|nr:Os03g0100600 [Oryza sativa Japonica Group]